MIFRSRQRRWLALLALLGLLFQQAAMAMYACPHDGGRPATEAMSAAMPGCHHAIAGDKARCAAHCHPQASSTDHAPVPAIPAALLPATTWLRTARTPMLAASGINRCAVSANATAPPLTIRHCTFQI